MTTIRYFSHKFGDQIAKKHYFANIIKIQMQRYIRNFKNPYFY